jgi:hypothetical protein
MIGNIILTQPENIYGNVQGTTELIHVNPTNKARE